MWPTILLCRYLASRLDLHRKQRILDLAPQVRARPVNVVDLDAVGLKDVRGEKLPRPPNVRVALAHFVALLHCLCAGTYHTGGGRTKSYQAAKKEAPVSGGLSRGVLGREVYLEQWAEAIGPRAGCQGLTRSG